VNRSLLCAVAVLLATAAPASAGDRLFAVTDAAHVVSFDSSAPGALLSDRTITGLGGTETITAARGATPSRPTRSTR